jgi:hypothetical protein
MLPMITNIYKQKTKGATLMGLFIATGKLKSFFWQLETFDVCTTGDTAHIKNLCLSKKLFQKACIIAAVKNIDEPMLTCVWQELEYRIDLCRVTRGAHIEHL